MIITNESLKSLINILKNFKKENNFIIKDSELFINSITGCIIYADLTKLFLENFSINFTEISEFLSNLESLKYDAENVEFTIKKYPRSEKQLYEFTTKKSHISFTNTINSNKNDWYLNIKELIKEPFTEEDFLITKEFKSSKLNNLKEDYVNVVLFNNKLAGLSIGGGFKVSFFEEISTIDFNNVLKSRSILRFAEPDSKLNYKKIDKNYYLFLRYIDEVEINIIENVPLVNEKKKKDNEF